MGKGLGEVLFLQPEDGIRVFHVTGVQTCALPISSTPFSARCRAVLRPRPRLPPVIRAMFASVIIRFSWVVWKFVDGRYPTVYSVFILWLWINRSEERRVGNGCGSGGSVYRERSKR